jgi:hypothetical protein
MSGARWRRPGRVLVLLTIAVSGLLPAAVASSAVRAKVAVVTNATTGMPDASLSFRPVCPAPTATNTGCDLDVLVTRTGGHLVHPRLARASSPLRTRARPAEHPRLTIGSGGVPSALAASLDLPAGPAVEPQPGTPAYLQQAYDLVYLSATAGTSDTVAIADAYDDPNAESDLQIYRSMFDLPVCSSANGCFRKVNESGQNASPAANVAWGEEISLDLDAVSAVCPNCHILLVEAKTSQIADLSGADSEANALGADQISDSWGGSGAAASLYASDPFTFPGVTTVAASGDNGYNSKPGRQIYPAALPDVTAAGGTTLTVAQSARGFSESAWSGTGSGCDVSSPKPNWQTDSSCAGRAYNDLSADADPNTGMAVYDSFGVGGWFVAGGTSEAAPLIAAYYALTSAAGPAWAWQHASLLNDPQSGANGSCAVAYICQARPGYDGPTGAGSISGDVASGSPGIGGPGPTGNYAQSVTTTTAQLQAGVYPNGLDTTYWVQYGPTSTYGQSTTRLDAGASPTPTTVSSLLTGLAPATTYHYRVVAQNSLGTTYGYDFALTTPAAATAPPAPAPVSPPAPSLATVAATAITVTSSTATVTATVNPHGSATNVTASYGASGRIQTSTPPASVTGVSDVTVRFKLTGLSANTTYELTLRASNAAGTVVSAHRRFGTRPKRPVIDQVMVSRTRTTVRIAVTVSSEGAGTTCYLAYGTTRRLRSHSSPQTIGRSKTPHRVLTWTLSGLSPRTRFHVSAVATNAGGVSTSSPKAFTTLPSARGR